MEFSIGLKKNDDFRNVYRRGKSVADKYFVMYVSENHMDINRLGISVSKKTGNSVVRHRLKRLIKESYRRNESVFNSGLDIVVVVRKAAVDIRYDTVTRSLLHLAKIHKISKVQKQ